MITLETLVENIKKIKNVNSYILSHKKNLQNCGIYDDDPFLVENNISNGTGVLTFLNFHLNQEGIPVDNDLLKFLEEFEDNELSIEYDWEADGSFIGSYWPGNYDCPPEYPEWSFDEFNLTNVKVVNSNNETIFTIPSNYYNLIEYFIDQDSISDQLEEERADFYED